MEPRIVLFSNLASEFSIDNLEAVVSSMKKANFQFTFMWVSKNWTIIFVKMVTEKFCQFVSLFQETKAISVDASLDLKLLMILAMKNRKTTTEGQEGLEWR